MARPDESARKRDQRLIEAARRGDIAAFEELYGLYKERAYALALRVTGRHEDALDVVQEAFLYVLRKLPTLELTGRLSTLLHPVVTHLGIAARERSGRYANENEAFEASLQTESTDDAEALRRADLARLLRGLPAAQREVVILRFVDGLTLEEVGMALSVPIGTVKSRLHAAIAALRADPRTGTYFEPD